MSLHFMDCLRSKRKLHYAKSAVVASMAPCFSSSARSRSFTPPSRSGRRRRPKDEGSRSVPPRSLSPLIYRQEVHQMRRRRRRKRRPRSKRRARSPPRKPVGSVRLLTRSLQALNKEYKSVSGETLPKSETLNSNARHQYSKEQEPNDCSLSKSRSESSGTVRNKESTSRSAHTHFRWSTSSEKESDAGNSRRKKYLDNDRPSAGKIYNGVVTLIKQRGCFVELEGLKNVWEGLVHLCEMKNDDHMLHAEDIVEKGQRVKVKVLSFNGERIRLSMKDIDQDTGKDLRP